MRLVTAESSIGGGKTCTTFHVLASPGRGRHGVTLQPFLGVGSVSSVMTAQIIPEQRKFSHDFVLYPRDPLLVPKSIWPRHLKSSDASHLRREAIERFPCRNILRAPVRATKRQVSRHLRHANHPPHAALAGRSPKSPQSRCRTGARPA
jgi:hypothetical protein